MEMMRDVKKVLIFLKIKAGGYMHTMFQILKLCLGVERIDFFKERLGKVMVSKYFNVRDLW